ncbi:MAG: DUF4160 domain-containing protein [Stellaceae bacterium]
MPTVFRASGFRFFFYSNEGRPREPVHIHVERDAGEAKLWLRPAVAVAYNDGLSPHELATALRLAEANRDAIETAWSEFFA